MSPTPRRLPDASARLLTVILALVALMAAAGAYCLFRPIPPPRITLSVATTVPARTYAIPWPSAGTNAVAVDGLGVVDGHGVDVPVSTASIAKVILALCVLQRAPLSPGQQGHAFTISAADVAEYHEAASWNGSTLPVVAGERLTEYQALQALMIPSADNIADSLARWVFGGHAAFKAYATAWLKAHHLDATVIGDDASGLDVDTRSTARDLTALGLIAMKDPVLGPIMGQAGAVFPVVGYQPNYATVLGQGGITAGKTGNNRDNRGAFLFTSTVAVGGRRVDVAAVILGQPDLGSALAAAPPVMTAVRRGLQMETVVRAGQVVGEARTPWGEESPALASADLTLLRWVRAPIGVDVADGWVTARSGGTSERVRLHLADARGPSWWWRLIRN